MVNQKLGNVGNLRIVFPEFPSSKFLILSIGSKSKSQKRKNWEKISKVSHVSEVSKFSTWPLGNYDNRTKPKLGGITVKSKKSSLQREQGGTLVL